jgi:hypothetical protein
MHGDDTTPSSPSRAPAAAAVSSAGNGVVVRSIVGGGVVRTGVGIDVGGDIGIISGCKWGCG